MLALYAVYCRFSFLRLLRYHRCYLCANTHVSLLIASFLLCIIIIIIKNIYKALIIVNHS